MSGIGVTEERKQELLVWAERMGRTAAEQAYGEKGPGLEVTLTEMEDLVVEVQRAFGKGMCEELTSRQAQQLPETLPCPACGRECRVERPEEGEEKEKRTRRIQTRSGSFDLVEPRAYCRHCRRSFFPSTGGVAD